MNASLRRMLTGAIFFALTCIVAVTGYMIAGWEMLDAIYMVVITVFGVGYGEAKPLDNPGLKIFTMGVIIAGCSSGIYVVGGFVSMVAEGEINKALGGRRMTKEIEKLSNHAIICGYGRVGQMLAHDLAKANQPFVIIDNNDGRVQSARAAGYFVLQGSASEEETLEAAGISRARVLATVLPDDTTNVFITLSARELNGTMEIIARAESPSTEKKLMRSGATRIVMPALIGATKIAQMIMRPTAEDLLQAATGTAYLNEELKSIGLEMMEISVQAGSPLCEQPLNEVEVGSGFVIVAIRQPDGHCVRDPKANVRLGPGDVLIILGHQGVLPQLARKARARTAVSFRGNTQ
ncbi:MAG TPA: NAD-binding protein [Pirellulales bacterium]|nr:NAD-binding protein [Pirellulales bacterium]